MQFEKNVIVYTEMRAERLETGGLCMLTVETEMNGDSKSQSNYIDPYTPILLDSIHITVISCPAIATRFYLARWGYRKDRGQPRYL
jgi:hypothetical protein